MNQQQPQFHRPSANTLPVSTGTWLTIALVFVLVTIGSFYVSSLLWPAEPAGDDDPTPVTPSSAPSTLSTPSTQPRTLGWTAVPHAPEGVFLAPSYAEGARELMVDARNEVEFVGSSLDGGIVAVNVDYEVRGIDVATAQTVWTFQSYSCSEGTWEGVALCVDANPITVLPGDVPDMIGLDLATGETTFRFTPASEPYEGRYSMNFIGADDVHGYFAIGLSNKEASGVEQHMLALTKDGQVSWITPLGMGPPPRSAALVANDRIAVDGAGTILMVDRATGAVALDMTNDGEPPTFMWDGWSTYVNEGEKRTKVFDQEGAPVGEFEGVDRFIPVDGRGRIVAVPVYEFEALTRTDSVHPDPWAVTQDGEPVLENVVYDIRNVDGDVMAEGVLEGLSADGSLFLSDQGSGAVHDAESGEVIGGFTKEHNTIGPGISDGIVIQPVRTDDYVGIAVLLPGAPG